MVTRVCRLRVDYVRVNRSGSGRGWHVVVGIGGRVAPLRVVLVQALLGSDWKRELFNTRRAMSVRRTSPFWRERANVLYVRHYRGVEL